jgi:hypothetical protein
MPRFCVLLALLAASCAPLAWCAAEEPAQVSYSRDIRPILSQNCLACHGPDAEHREADLRLDLREGAVASGAIVPHQPDDSEILTRIASDDPEMRMPPPHTKKSLTATEQELLRRWVAQGADYAEHWAFLPVVKPTPPSVQNHAAVENEIDRFIIAELEKRQLTPSPPADRAALIRRLSLDLIGLLPSPAEVEAFVADERPTAYEELVDRLLASPHYGERWGRHWLDQARYADSNGYTIDSLREMWPYRDWVVKALNDDMPFTQFTIEQLAGDLLPQPTKLQRIATGFHRNTMINEEGGTDAEQFRNEIVIDRVNTTGSVWLGLTLGCAQCHSHKFDPVSHRDYFQFFAFFNSGTDVNNRGATVEVLPGEVLGTTAADAVENQVAEAARRKLAAVKQEAAARQVQWEEWMVRDDAEPQWTPLGITHFAAESGRQLQRLDDGSLLATKAGAPKDIYTLQATLPLQRITALRLLVLPHETLPGGGAGTAGNGNFVLSELELSVGGKRVALQHAVADHQKNGYPVLAAIDGRHNSGWALEMAQGGKGEHEAWFYLAEPLEAGNEPVTVRLRHDVNDHYLIGRFALFATDAARVAHPDRKQWQAAVAIAKRPSAERTKEELQSLAALYSQLDHALAAAQQEADRTAKLATGAATQMVMRELDKPRTTYLLTRGDFLNPDKNLGPLLPATPAWLPPLQPASETPTRLDLARWLVRDDNPLTPRVVVNRVWMQYFGRGLVETESDFGMQGTSPSHPELLDYLAAEFVERGWSLKRLHRAIVLSATYRQASRYRPELQEADPGNVLLARQQRLRLAAETVRDAALSASGLLAPALGGPTVRPPQPEGVYAFTQNAQSWIASTGADRYRRALYTTFIRSAPYPLFTTFDAPNFSTACTSRPRSNTPLQALTLANDEAFLEFAQAFAARLWREVPTADETGDRARITRAFAVCMAREPSAKEADAVLAYLRRQQASFSADSAAAQAAAPGNRLPQLTPADAAAWSAVARALLNADEFVTRE